MHSLIISFIGFLKKDKRKKVKNRKPNLVNYEKIFDSDDDVNHKSEHINKITPSYIYEFNFEKLFKAGITIPTFNLDNPIILVIGEISVGKTQLIEELLFTPLANILKKNNQILCYQSQGQYIMEYTIDWNCYESLFICDVLHRISDATIIINNSVNQSILQRMDRWSPSILIHKCKVQYQRQFIIDQKKLKLYQHFNNCYYRKNNFHLFQKEDETICYVKQLLDKKPNKLQLQVAIQMVLNQSTYLLPFKLELKYNQISLKLAQPLQNLDIVKQYIKDYYNNSEQILKFTFGEEYTLVRIARPFLKCNCREASVENSQLILTCTLRDLRFNFIIPFIYKRQCAFTNVKIIIQQDEFFVLQFA